MRGNYKVYKLLEVIEMPKDTKVHMINGKDYKINDKGELVPERGEKLPISKKNIESCEFTIIEELKNYNFRVYRDGALIQCFNKIIEESRARILAKDLYDSYKDKEECPCYNAIGSLDDRLTMFYVPRHVVEVKLEEIVELLKS